MYSCEEVDDNFYCLLLWCCCCEEGNNSVLLSPFSFFYVLKKKKMTAMAIVLVVVFFFSLISRRKWWLSLLSFVLPFVLEERKNDGRKMVTHLSMDVLPWRRWWHQVVAFLKNLFSFFLILLLQRMVNYSLELTITNDLVVFLNV